MSATQPGAYIDGPSPTAPQPTTLSRARSGFKNFSRRFDRKPKPLNIAELPQANPAGASQSGTNTRVNGNGAKPVTPTRTTNDSAYGSSPQTPENNARNSTSSALSSPRPNLRPPQPHRLHSQIFASSTDFKLPELPWLCGTWYITHSSLPVWRDKRDVRVVYTRTTGDKLDDVVTYSPAAGGPQEQVRGVDKVLPDGSYLWRGRGFGMIKVGKWEVLGWGGGSAGGKGAGANLNDEQWVITYFSKTMFSPPGIDICSRERGGLSPRKLQKLLEALQGLDEVLMSEERGGKQEGGKGDFGRLVESMFEVPR